jgi:hypothetical protein
MQLSQETIQGIGAFLHERGLLAAEEVQVTNELASPEFAFAPQIEAAESIHYHIHVRNTDNLPHEELLELEGLNLIFSHIPVAQKEKSVHAADEAYLDHIGIDIRSEDKSAYLAFQQIPFLCAVHDYLFARQGDGKEAVKCCHMQVREKYWVYPNPKINYEFAFGTLVINSEGVFGVDLRPANPFNKVQEATACCGGVAPTVTSTKPAIFVSRGL